MGRMRKHKQEEPENLERWLVSYADFVTLLFAFFVVMYAISSVNEGKYRVLSETMVDAFKQPLKEEGINKAPLLTNEVTNNEYIERNDASVGESPEKPEYQPAGEADVKPEDDRLWAVASNLDSSLEAFVDKGLVDISLQGDKIEIQLNNKMLFGSGSTKLSDNAKKAFKDIATIIKPLKNTIHVEGHTDNVPIKTRAFPSNWELSAARAASVVSFLQKNGVDPKRLVAMGFGEHRPVASNQSEKGRSRNRRVTLIIRSEKGASPYGELAKPEPAADDRELPWAEAPGASR